MRLPGRVPWTAAVAIAAAAAQFALLVLALVGRLAPVIGPGDGAWLAIWVGYALTGAVVLERRPGSLVGFMLCLIGALPAVSAVVELVADGGAGRTGAALYAALPPLLLVGLPAVFPDGLRRSRLRVVGLTCTAALVGLGSGGVLLAGEQAQVGVVVTSAVLGLACLSVQASSARRAMEPVRTQRRIFVWGFGGTAAVMAVGGLASMLVPEASSTGSWLQLVGLWCIPAAVVLAMLAGGLWDTDLARGRQAAHVGLVASIGAVLGLVVVTLASLLRTPSGAALAAVVGSVVSVPVLWVVWRRAARRLYGPGGVEPSAELDDADEAELAGLVAAALRAPSGRIVRDDADRLVGALVVPLGAGRSLVVEPRRVGESFTRRDERAAYRMAQMLAARLERRDLERDLETAHRALGQYREREQRRLRAALHDEVGPLLVGAEMQALAMSDRVAGNGLGPEVARLSASLTEARKALRFVLEDGSPRALAGGLVAALSDLCGGWVDPPVTLSAEDDVDVSSELAVAIYRLVAESLANVSQHAHATSCCVSISVAENVVTVVIEDNGVGIEPSRPQGIGLASMRGRALELGGDVTVGPRNPGTRVVGRFPIGGGEA